MTVSVLVPAKNRQLTTYRHVQQDLGLALGSPGDEQLNRWIDQASARAVSFCRRTFARETVRERLDFRCWTLDEESGGVRLDRAPVVSIEALTIDGVAIAVGGFETEGPWLFLLDGPARRPWYGRAAIVDYAGGWVLPGDADAEKPPLGAELLPADIERAVIQMVGASISSASRDMLVKSETTEGVGRTDYFVQGAASTLAHPEAEATLTQYRRMLSA